MDRVANRFALLCVVGQSLAALKRPAQVSVVCNDARALTAMKQAAHRSELGGEYATPPPPNPTKSSTALPSARRWESWARLPTERDCAGWRG